MSYFPARSPIPTINPLWLTDVGWCWNWDSFFSCLSPVKHSAQSLCCFSFSYCSCHHSLLSGDSFHLLAKAISPQLTAVPLALRLTMLQDGFLLYFWTIISTFLAFFLQAMLKRNHVPWIQMKTAWDVDLSNTWISPQSHDVTLVCYAPKVAGLLLSPTGFSSCSRLKVLTQRVPAACSASQAFALLLLSFHPCFAFSSQSDPLLLHLFLPCRIWPCGEGPLLLQFQPGVWVSTRDVLPDCC